MLFSVKVNLPNRQNGYAIPKNHFSLHLNEVFKKSPSETGRAFVRFRTRILLRTKRINRIGQRRFYRLGTHGEQGNHQRQSPRSCKNPLAEVDSSGEFLQPAVHSPPNERRGNCHRFESDFLSFHKRQLLVLHEAAPNKPTDTTN